MRWIKTTSIVLLFFLLGSLGIVRAEDGAARVEEPKLCPFCLKANDPDVGYLDKTSNTLIRGILNTTLGWTEVLRVPAKHAREDGNIWNGLASGLGSGVTRTLNGLAEIFTFWTPKVGDNYIHFSTDCPLDTTQ